MGNRPEARDEVPHMRLGRRRGAQRSQIARNPMFGLTPGIFNRSMHAAIATTLPGADRVTKSSGRNNFIFKLNSKMPCSVQ